ncbi:response regulator transcription factor [Petralouisia muris]|jgi:DNA-binding LytR/AlgR family response regulator|uniref:Response regulator transcription factor n=1 Tax=Petralouisia muris TaxID=3032872 RepID=A0AC61S239_9FIRM|nr:LytTR family DNA-binding domain-containing protein [Petralouisia muris]TGY97989.1 response regulator transcription factor [Petralouisia muris]
MQIAVCDDEKEIRDMFAQEIGKLYPEADLSLYQSGEELLLSGGEPDILLLDIQMPGKNGMETAKELRRKNKKAIIIFVTALDDFVFQAFDVGAFHYLVKPLDGRKFSEVLLNAVKQFEDRKKLDGASRKRELPSLMITTGGKHITVNLEDIVYAEVFDRKVILHTMDSDIEYYGKMRELEEKAGDEFYRTHRSFLVNFGYIRKYDATTVYLKKGQALMAKQNYQGFVKSYLRYNQRKGRT